MSEAEVEEWVCNWIGNHMPQALKWNFDENESRSIDLFHVHVYVEQCIKGQVTPLSGSKHVLPCDSSDSSDCEDSQVLPRVKRRRMATTSDGSDVESDHVEVNGTLHCLWCWARACVRE